ncbi:Pantothenate transporter Liz1 [Mycena kentingensis (nom. inval.)]|nr:Pantothenate transporter Liz1 [Mycena kentingensis (nom. inval.)]
MSPTPGFRVLVDEILRQARLHPESLLTRDRDLRASDLDDVQHKAGLLNLSSKEQYLFWDPICAFYLPGIAAALRRLSLDTQPRAVSAAVMTSPNHLARAFLRNADAPAPANIGMFCDLVRHVLIWFTPLAGDDDKSSIDSALRDLLMQNLDTRLAGAVALTQDDEDDLRGMRRLQDVLRAIKETPGSGYVAAEMMRLRGTAEVCGDDACGKRLPFRLAMTEPDAPGPAVKLSFWNRLRSFVWDSDAHLKTPEERALVRKLDFGILVVSCLGFFLKYLEIIWRVPVWVIKRLIGRSSFQKDISGMKEDLHINAGTNTLCGLRMGTCYTIAYAIMQVPSTMIIQKIRPSFYLAFCEIGWGIWTFAQAGATSSQQMYALRFLVGLFEAAFFPRLLHLMGSWYTKTELAKRAPSGPQCPCMYLQAAVYTNLNGRGGLAGWRWLYIVSGCMTVPCGALLLFVLPDVPSNSRAWYLSQEEKEFALQRAIKHGKAQPTGKFDMALFKLKRTFSRWHWYWFVFGYVLYGSSCAATGYFGIWLKSENFSVSARNVIPSCSALFNIVAIFLWGFLSDLTGSRFTWVFIPLAYGLIPNGILAVWLPSVRLKEFAFLTGGVQLMTAVFYTWANEVCKDERALVVSSMNGLQYAVAAWLPIVIFPQVEAPTLRKGSPGTFGLVIAALLVIIIIKLLADRDERRAITPQNEAEEASPSRKESDEKHGSIQKEFKVGD